MNAPSGTRGVPGSWAAVRQQLGWRIAGARYFRAIAGGVGSPSPLRAK